MAVIFGLLSVGIGFGLQNVTSNFIASAQFMAPKGIFEVMAFVVGEFGIADTA
ncbi:MAG: hypothetical protein ABSD38_38325 [Syntrophorhabdales bacterium]